MEMENQGKSLQLRKENFPLHMEKMINDIKNDEDFHDIVLITDNGSIKAHKLILAAFSSGFKYVQICIFLPLLLGAFYRN